MSYVLPQVQVFQLFNQLPVDVVANLNAFVFGPHYQLFRYGTASEKELIGLGAYDRESDQEFAYPNQPVGSIVDLSYVKLYMENVWAQYLHIPADADNPINVVSVEARNKLRAAPVIADPENVDLTHPSLGTDGRGYFVGGVTLPEDYYLYPYGGWDGAAWDEDAYQADITTGSGEDAKLKFITSEGLTGEVDVANTDNPLDSGVLIPGPDGLQLDFDAGSGDNVLRKPITVWIRDVATTSYFTISVDPLAIRDAIDWDIDDSLPIRISINLAAGANAVSWSNVTRTLTITSLNYRLAALQAALEADSDIATYFDISEVTGTGTNAVNNAVDDAGAAVGVGPTALIPTAYRIRINPNPYIFKTGNGYNRSAQLKSRDVQVGDRIRYQITDGSSVVHTGTSKIVGIEADTTLATVADPTMKDTNAATQVATTMTPKTGADIIEAGADNQRAFDGVDTKLYALHYALRTYPGEMSAGLISDTYTVEITASGAAGTAECTITNAGGTYSREAVVIEEDPTGDTTRARVYLGRNLWIMFDQGTGDADAEFQAGDTYTFTVDVDATFTALTADDMSVDGVYTGPRDTTYVVEVIRGGVFNRTSNTIDGLTNASKFVITYTGQPAPGDIVNVAGVQFVADSDFAIGVTDDDTYANLVTAINASAGVSTCYAVQDTAAGTVTVTGAGYLISLCFLGTDITGTGDYTNATDVTDAVRLVSVIDWDDWTGGDNDDEYVLKCTVAGNITSAEFELTSQRGDDDSALKFNGWGTVEADAQAVGGHGLKLYFEDLRSTTPTFGVGDYYIVKVNASRPQVRISDSAGVDNGSTEVVNDAVAFDLGEYGVTMTFNANTNREGNFCAGGGLVKGDVFYVATVAAADGPFKTLVLADDLPAAITTGLDADGNSNGNPNNGAIWLYMLKSSVSIGSKRTQSPPDRNWLAEEDKVTVYEGLEIQDASWYDVDGSMPYMPVYQANMYLEYRALLQTYTDTIHFISDIGDVATEIGTITPDNPLAQGVYNALLNSGNRGVYYIGVPTDDLAGFLSVLDKATLSQDVYGLVPLTRDLAILDAVEAHINAMSTETEKRWRIGFFGSTMDVIEVVYARSNNPASDEYYAKVSNDGSGAYLLVNFVTADGDPSPYTNVLDDVVAGDEVRINFSTDAWGDESYDTYEVDEVLTNTSLRLVAGPASPITIPSKVEVWHDLTVAEMAESVAAHSSRFANRRVYNVFPAELGAFGVLQTSEFGAAAVSGLMSSVPPQQGITNIELNGFDDLPQVYSTFNRTQLNQMAAAGTLIIMQDVAGGRIYIRHQVSTAAADGNINTTELSVTKNLDSISYYFANRLEPFIGRYNVTPTLLAVLGTQIEDGLSYLGSFTDLGLLGPQLILDGTRLVSLQQHPSLQDHVLVTVNVQLPYPLNVLELRLVV